MQSKSLIAIVTLISYCGCAAQIPYIDVGESMVIVDGPSSAPSINGLMEIDPENPPEDGLWMTWDDAIVMAKFLRNERLANETKHVLMEKQLNIADYKLKMAEKQLKDSNSPTKQWWFTWGFPIGMALGVVLGVVTPIAIQGATK